ncbi:MAG: alanine racemase, partial [Granulicella sp.]
MPAGDTIGLGWNRVTNWIEVAERRLAENYLTAAGIVARESGGDAALLAVIKANGYGHGAALCAPVLARAGTGWLGVTNAAEGIAVRSALSASGIDAASQPRVLIMCGHLPEDASAIVQ